MARVTHIFHFHLLNETNYVEAICRDFLDSQYLKYNAFVILVIAIFCVRIVQNQCDMWF